MASSRWRAAALSVTTAPRPTIASVAATSANATNTRIRKRHGALSPSTTLRIVTASPIAAAGSISLTAARTAGRDGALLAVDADEQVRRPVAALRDRHVEIEARIVQAAEADVLHHADHRLPDAGGRILRADAIGGLAQALANRIAARPQPPGRALADDRDAGRRRGVGIGEHPAAHQPRAHRREVVRRHGHEVHVRVQAPRRRILRPAGPGTPAGCPSRWGPSAAAPAPPPPSARSAAPRRARSVDP